MAAGAGLLALGRRGRPERLALPGRQHGGIGEIVLLHRLRVRAHLLEAGAALVRRDGIGVGGGEGREEEGWHQPCASFEASLREAPQDEEGRILQAASSLILRCEPKASLEGRTRLMRHQPSTTIDAVSFQTAPFSSRHSNWIGPVAVATTVNCISG